MVGNGAKQAGYTICKICDHVGMSRQNYYAVHHNRRRRQINEQFILKLVIRERQLQPRLGGRKLLHLLKPELEQANVQIGRDRFFKLLSKKGLLVEPKPRRARTTNSRHSLPVFRNLLKEQNFSHPNEAWVSDLTYIRTDEGFLYAALITDVVSQKVVDAHIGDTLETQGCLKALNQALSQLPEGKYPIHHSDRGCQYFSRVYVEKLQKNGLSISMTQIMHCYENAMAERVNGILKQEYEDVGESVSIRRACASCVKTKIIFGPRS